MLVAAESISNSPSRPASRTRCFITNSAIVERQMLPWQTKRMRVGRPDIAPPYPRSAKYAMTAMPSAMRYQPKGLKSCFLM